MTDLFERVLHHIEGNETEIQNWETKTGTESYSVSTFGPDRWIERAALGRLMAIDLLAVILFSVRDSFDLEGERRIVEGWAVELRNAASSGEIQARDPVTLLALETLPDGWEWLISAGDADKFIAARGMGWAPSEQIEFLLEQSRKEGTQYKDPKTGQTMKHYWLAGFEPPEADTKPQAAPEPAPMVEVPASEPPARRRTLWDVATTYIVEIMRAGQYANAKQLFNGLEAKAGAGSPFDKGTGNNRGSLFAREISQPMALKTLQTRWPILKAAAKK